MVFGSTFASEHSVQNYLVTSKCDKRRPWGYTSHTHTYPKLKGRNWQKKHDWENLRLSGHAPSTTKRGAQRWEIPKSEAKTSDIGNLAFLACIYAQSHRRDSCELSSPRKRQIRPLFVKKKCPLSFWAVGRGP